jgi:hypothetical protein
VLSFLATIKTLFINNDQVFACLSLAPGLRRCGHWHVVFHQTMAAGLRQSRTTQNRLQ